VEPTGSDSRCAGLAKRVSQALRSCIEPLRRFARRSRPYASGILAHCRYPLGTNLIEGINNKIKVIKRMARGFRDDAYLLPKDPHRLPRGLGEEPFLFSIRRVHAVSFAKGYCADNASAAPP
jgi:Transposase